ncbi:MAG: EVE domain-containing protein [Candidatus Paceibacterota bacterium]
MNYWLFKSEPTSYSIDNLKRDKKTAWDGVRNYQARNFMRDDMQIGDIGLFYHSNTKPIGIVGVVKICSKPYPDPTAFDKKDDHYDPQSKKENPTWYLVDVCFVEKFNKIITLDQLKFDDSFSDMLVTQKGQRLSVQPVSKKHVVKILKMADAKSKKYPL